MNWKIGDIGICIKIGHIKGNTELMPPPLRLNAEYVIQNIYQCPKCKDIAFDVGLSNQCDDDGEYAGTRCCTELIPCKEIHWCSSKRFIKKKTKEEQLEEAIKEENYEKAGELRDELNEEITN